MDTFSIRLPVVVVTLLFLSVTKAVLPNGQCYVNNMTCEISDNFIGIADNIMSAEDCKRECLENSTGCKVYSYYGPGGVPFRDTCLLFNDCSILEQVEDCVTEDISCTIFCNAPVEGILSDNVIDIVPDVSEAACEAECEVEELCQFFTFHFSNSTLYPNTCFLLSEIREPITACQEDETCTSGSPNCENSLCGFLENGILFSNGIMVTESKEIDLLTIGPCSSNDVVAVVVGGGGRDIYVGGAGSGYVEFKELQFSRPYMQLEATVGSSEQQSMLTSISDGDSDILVTALPGQGVVEGGFEGGDGYSGGGGGSPNDSSDVGGVGGSDGGDGAVSEYGGAGGKGSGFDIRNIPITNFVLR